MAGAGPSAGVTRGFGAELGTNYCALCIQPQHSAAWMKQMKRLCALCRFATCFDKLLMAAGLFCAFLSGGVQCVVGEFAGFCRRES